MVVYAAAHKLPLIPWFTVTNMASLGLQPSLQTLKHRRLQVILYMISTFLSSLSSDQEG